MKFNHFEIFPIEVGLFFTLWWPSQGDTDIFIEMPIRGYSRIEDVRALQTKQFTSDLHRLSDSKRVVQRATHSMNTVESLKKVCFPRIISYDFFVTKAISGDNFIVILNRWQIKLMVLWEINSMLFMTSMINWAECLTEVILTRKLL